MLLWLKNIGLLHWRLRLLLDWSAQSISLIFVFLIWVRLYFRITTVWQGYFAGGKLHFAGGKLYFAGGKLYFAGGKLHFAGGKLYFAGGNHTLRMATYFAGGNRTLRVATILCGWQPYLADWNSLIVNWNSSLHLNNLSCYFI